MGAVNKDDLTCHKKRKKNKGRRAQTGNDAVDIGQPRERRRGEEAPVMAKKPVGHPDQAKGQAGDCLFLIHCGDFVSNVSLRAVRDAMRWRKRGRALLGRGTKRGVGD